jgi:predicted aspartyl protease
MGKVMEIIKLTNSTDLDNADRGLIPPADVRTVAVEALVDRGAARLVVPEDVVRALGLVTRGTRAVRYANGQVGNVPWVGPIRLEILGREMNCDALVEPAGTTPLIGQIPLEALDLLVDPKSRSLHVNPASPNTPLLDLLSVA